MSDPGDAPGDAVPDQGATEDAQTRHLRGSSLLLLGRLMALAIDFAGHVLLVRTLLKEDFGAFTYALAAATLLTTIVLLGLPEAIARYTPIYRHQGALDKVLGAVAVAAGVVALAGAAIVLAVVLLPGPLRDVLGSDQAATVLAVLILIVPLNGVNQVAQAMFAAFGRVRVVFLRQYVVVPLTRFAVVLLLVTGDRGIVFLAVGYVVVSALGLLLYGSTGLRPLLRRLRTARPDIGALPAREVMSFALPVFVTSVFWLVLQGLGAVSLGLLRGDAEVADYTAVLQPARLNLLVIIVFSILFTPTASSLYARGELAELRQTYLTTASWLTLLTVPVVALTTIFASTFVPTFFGARYESSILVLALLAAGFYFSAAVGPNGPTLKVFRRLKLTVGIDVACILLGVGLYAALIPPLGAAGAAGATLCAIVVRNLALQVALRQVLGLRMLAGGYLRVVAGAAAALAGLAAVKLAFEPGIIVAALLCAAAGLGLAFGFRRALDLERTFPELARGPLGWLVRS